MRSYINLMSGGRVGIKSEDFTSISSILQAIHQRVDKLYEENEQEHIQCLSAAVCVIVAEVFMNSGLPQGDLLKYPHTKIHPLRSLVYYGQSRLCDIVSFDLNLSPQEFMLNEFYFADVFLLHEALILEERRNQKDQNYAIELASILKRKKRTYAGILNRQNNAYAKLAYLLNNPTNN